MLKSIKEGWSIIILGRWNVSIFSPAWLTKHVFDDPELIFDFPMEPGQSHRITGNKVQLIPANNKLLLKATEIDDDTLNKMESIACNLLKTLCHTPVQATGINFVFEFRGKENRDQLLEHFPIKDDDKFAEQGMELKQREMIRSFEIENRILNLKSTILRDAVRFDFNFHFSAVDALETAARLKDTVLKSRKTALSILDTVYGLREEEI